MDFKLNYTQKGRGTPLLLLHGNGEDNTYFECQLEYFSRYYWVIAPDTRGHGKTPRGEAPFSIRQFADDLYDFMKELSIEKADILGFSDGANIAVCFAIKYPYMVNRLVLNGGNLDSKGVKASVQIPIEIGYRIASLFSNKSNEAKRNAEMLGLMVNDPNISPMELHALNMPVLVIAGTKDMIKESHTRLIYENLPDAELKFIEGDHFIAKKNSEKFNLAVAEFLKRK